MLLKKKINNLLRLLFITLIVMFVVSCDNNDDNNELKVFLPPTINPSDSIALVDMYRNMAGDKWEKSQQWDLNDPKTWSCVEFTTDENGLKVAEKIRMPSIDDVSTFCYIPQSIGKLKHLREFTINNAKWLNGKIPESIFWCPIEKFIIKGSDFLLGQLSGNIGIWGTTLKYIEISNCPNFVSIIPHEIGNCINAKIVFNNCHFYGKVPIELIFLKISPEFSGNHLSAIDWRFFTEDGEVPGLSYNDFLGEVPMAVQNTDKWKKHASSVFYPFNEEYGFCNISLAPKFNTK